MQTQRYTTIDRADIQASSHSEAQITFALDFWIASRNFLKVRFYNILKMAGKCLKCELVIQMKDNELHNQEV